MSGSNILKEFLISIGFKVDDQKYRNFQEVLKKTSQNAIDLAKATAGASTILGTSMRAIASHMQSMGFASQRTGSSVRELQDFSFAASQVGVSAEKAQASIEALAAARRANPGLNGMLGNLGIDPRQTDNAKVMVQLLGKLRAMPYYQGSQIAGMFGIDDQTFFMLEKGLPQMEKWAALRDRMFARSGITPDQIAQRSQVFMRDWNVLQAQTGTLADVIEGRLMPAGDKVLRWLIAVEGKLLDADKATDGWSSKIIGLASALLSLKVVPWATGKLLGRGAGAAAGAEGAAGAEAAAGTEAISILGLGPGVLALIASACGAAIVWMSLHPEAVRKAAIWAGKETEKGAKGAGHAIATEAGALPGQVENAARDLKSDIHALGFGNVAAIFGAAVAPQLTNAIISAANKSADFIRKNEGVLRKATWDYRGYSIGYGHQIQPGEHFDGPITDAGALKLLASDLQKTLASIATLVKVKLTDSQRTALADLEFNIGQGSFKNSTLLKMLNAGDFAGAADQFARWDKVFRDGHYLVDPGLQARRERDAALFRGSDKAVTLHQQTTIHVEGSDDPKSTAREVAREQNRVNGDMVRNGIGAVQ